MPNVDLNRHYHRSILDDNLIDGFTFTPQVSSVTIAGPTTATRPKDTPSRDKIFICKPGGASDELPCARKILTRRLRGKPIAGRSRIPIPKSLMNFIRPAGTRETSKTESSAGCNSSWRIPEFVFRTEDGPANVKPGQAYRISDLELASRLAFFFWSSGPDDELIQLAAQGKLRDSGVLEQQVRRMLADQRTHELVKNFAGQWLQLRVMQSSTPEGIDYPDFDDNLRQAFRTEAEMFFESIVREDRSIIDLLEWRLYLRQRAAGRALRNSECVWQPVPAGEARRRLDVRRGLLGKGGIELVTSVSDRTSPVQRGKWVMTNILGVVPPDPPPNVPALKEAAAGGSGSAQPAAADGSASR